MTRVKVCGTTTHEDLDAVVEAGADAVGFIVDVSVDTPREITAKRAVELSRAAPPFVTTVLVTMPETPEETVALASRIQPDVVQVHGELTPGDLAFLSAKIHGDVVKAVSPESAPAYDTVADALLVDSLDSDGAGGTGETHDWERTRELVETLESPVVLAGGLTPDNVAAAVETVRPFGVDVASGVESDPGRKDTAAVSAFVRAAGGRP
ncbi:phosphoribosylanthranilate isomerase [Natronomonas sp. CBA1123]|jgi:phosphoribosylanthranilate isomerase|uniref:phosphoribosylanthranilate isomerase n=1 Tax=Natronomonas sp. CBA1123 TaxID=2668070 RepID=UPI0012EAFAF8|nr:phosphoribosylanthranilate isomerase [Natronomonas sp. CBA1123]MUV88428.1 phosphoribosylanthranilate isomerase [Natronomonas sp. CBA1123]